MNKSQFSTPHSNGKPGRNTTTMKGCHWIECSSKIIDHKRTDHTEWQITGENAHSEALAAMSPGGQVEGCSTSLGATVQQLWRLLPASGCGAARPLARSALSASPSASRRAPSRRWMAPRTRATSISIRTPNNYTLLQERQSRASALWYGCQIAVSWPSIREAMISWKKLTSSLGS